MKLVLLASWACFAFGFVTAPTSFVGRQTTLPPLYISTVIKGDDLDLNFDQGVGGVRLAEDSAIKISGAVLHKPGKADPSLGDLFRYNKLTEVSEAIVQASLNEAGAHIIATGRGAENYKDPGETAVSEITLAPMDAAHDALQAAGSLQGASRVVFNFLGGDDLQLLEVTDALVFLVKDALDIPTKAKIDFHSLSHNSFPSGRASLTIVAVNRQEEAEEETTKMEGIRSGEVYFHDGKWWTLAKADINTAIA